VEDYSGLTQKDAARKLKETGLLPEFLGIGENVTGQIPSPGEIIPGGSEVLLYLGEPMEQRSVTVPDFSGMNRQQAADAAGQLGLYLLVTGNREISPQVTVTAQNIPQDSQVPLGTTITLEFTDTTARD
jgi:stage V sporulation protein D (sporulation-specific penicillin-binding protein)